MYQCEGGVILFVNNAPQGTCERADWCSYNVMIITKIIVPIQWPVYTNNEGVKLRTVLVSAA